MYPPSDELPLLDCHAHIAADVTDDQLARLGGAQVFAVTRSLAEAHHIQPDHGGLVWGCGVHPGDQRALSDFSRDVFTALLERFVLIGEVGLDRRAGDLDRQRSVFGDVLKVIAGKPVITSVHSAGASGEVIDLLADHPHAGIILHWFLGSAAEVAKAADMGAYFSVNAAMPTAQIISLPVDRVLPESDYPVSRRKTKAALPGDTRAVEGLLAVAWDMDPLTVRRQLYRNLRRLALTAGALDRLPEQLADHLLAA